MTETHFPVTRMVWSPADAPPLPQEASERLREKKIAVIGGRAETADRLIQTLRRKGAIAMRYSGQPANPTDAARAFRREAGALDGIIDLNLEGNFSIEDRGQWQNALRSSVALLQAYYDDWLEEENSQRLFYMTVTRMGGRMGYGTEMLHQPLGGIWAGLAKTLPQELPNCNVRILDIADEDFRDLDGIVARELYRWGLFEIGYQGGVRCTLSACPQKQPLCARICSEDTILLSGGARGIGYALACFLAREYRCRVIVTGRDAVPDPGEPWITMEDGEFKRYQQELLRSASLAKGLAEGRRQIAREKRRRELFFNLKAAEVEGLPIEYRKCDVTCEGEVRALIQHIRGGLSIVVHNAGVDSPVRLPLKSADSFISTVEVKVEGFLNLLRAVEGMQLKMFCNVGSLTGRWGGMIGETDYAAANEGLSRLGMWAGQRFSFPVKTLCWPTWERLGMIKNFEVATKYMSPLSVKEGLMLWRNELNATGSGEVTFIGRVGRALNPIQIKGFPPAAGLANIDLLYTQFHHLGDVFSFRPFRSIRTTTMISARTAPLLDEFRAYGQQAIPPSLVLESMVGIGSWVQAEGWKDLTLCEIRDTVIRLRGLAVKEGTCVLEHFVEGCWVGQDWQLQITTRNVSCDQQTGRVTLIYSAGQLPAEPLRLEPLRSECPVNTASSDFEWRGLLIQPARWFSGNHNTLVGTAAPCCSSDLWSTPHPPLLLLPVAHLESIFRIALAQATRQTAPDSVRIGSMRLLKQSGPPHWVIRTSDRKEWWIVDEHGGPCMKITGLELDTGSADTGPTENHCVSVERR